MLPVHVTERRDGGYKHNYGIFTVITPWNEARAASKYYQI